MYSEVVFMKFHSKFESGGGQATNDDKSRGRELKFGEIGTVFGVGELSQHPPPRPIENVQ